MQITVETSKGRGIVAGFASSPSQTYVIVLRLNALVEVPISECKVISVDHVVSVAEVAE